MPVRPLGILSNTKRIRSFDWTTNPLSVRSGFRSINGLLVQAALERGHDDREPERILRNKSPARPEGESKMKVRPSQAAILCGLGLFAVSIAPIPPPADADGGILSAVIKPLRLLQREALAQEATPSHVYQAVSDLVSEIELLREAMGVTDYPLEAEPAEDRSPIHVFARTLELRRKVSGAQRRLGMAPSEVGQIPLKAIEPKDVLGSVRTALAEVRRVKEQLVIEDEIEPARFEGGKTPSNVYQHMGDASFLLDGLVGRPVNISDVFGSMTSLLSDMELVATKFKVALSLDLPEVTKKKRLKDVGQQVIRSTFKLINLQTRLGMDASGVPEVSLVRVTPANLYETVNIMHAEMVRIKVHLGVKLPAQVARGVARNKRPRDLFALTLLVVRNLDVLAKASDGYIVNQG